MVREWLGNGAMEGDGAAPRAHFDSDQVYRCAISPFCHGGWRRASLSVRHFAIV